MTILLDESIQAHLEDAVSRVIEAPDIRAGEGVVALKDRDDEQIVADILADACYASVARALEAVYVSEESPSGVPPGGGLSPEQLVLVADPIDGSSEMVRGGAFHAPLATATMVLRGANVLGAAVGDVWRRQIYGIGQSTRGSYFLRCRDVDGMKARVLQVSEAKATLGLDRACIAAYAPSRSQWRIDLLEPLFLKAAYVHNNGGHILALRVVEGTHERSYAAALELAPVGLWEHIGAVLAMVGGAVVHRMDGEPLALDIGRRQTAITAASPALASQIETSLEDRYRALSVLHDCPRGSAV